MALKNPHEMMAAVAAGMRERTGRTLQEWVVVVNGSGIDPLDQNAVRRWLKSEHSVPQNSQWAIADAAARAAGWERPGVEEYVDRQYAGEKMKLRPIFDRLRENRASVWGRRHDGGSRHLYAFRAAPAVCCGRRGDASPRGRRASLHESSRLQAIGGRQRARAGNSQAVLDLSGRDHPRGRAFAPGGVRSERMSAAPRQVPRA